LVADAPKIDRTGLKFWHLDVELAQSDSRPGISETGDNPHGLDRVGTNPIRSPPFRRLANGRHNQPGRMEMVVTKCVGKSPVLRVKSTVLRARRPRTSKHRQAALRFLTVAARDCDHHYPRPIFLANARLAGEPA